ncbi:MAG: hypothetical protein IJE10_04290 [Clostridia bacterium]|nr:hypothetical protein [Clostridia bacterium]
MKKTIASFLVLTMLMSLFAGISVFAEAKTDFEAFDLKYASHGMKENGTFRFIVLKSDVPFEITEDNMLNLAVKGVLEHDGGSIPFESYIKSVEMRDPKVVLVVPQTKEVTVKEFPDSEPKTKKHTFKCKIYPEIYEAPKEETSIVIQDDGPVQEMPYRANKLYYFLDTDNFLDNKGTWNVGQDSPFKNFDAYNKKDCRATSALTVGRDGTYYVWVRARDYATDKTGSRRSVVEINETQLPNQVGNHLGEGYVWQLAGTIDLIAGQKYDLSVVAATAYAKFDMVCVTNDSVFKPVNSLTTLKDIVVGESYDASKVVADNSPLPADPNRPNTEIAVNFNGEYMTFDVEPQLINDRTMVPLRAIFERLGCDVEWIDETQTVIAKRNGRTVAVTIGSNEASVAGNPAYVDQPPVLIDSRTLVPLRFVSEAFGCGVEWENDSQTVFIFAEEPVDATYIDANGFAVLGSWKYSKDGEVEILQGISDSKNEEGFNGEGAVPAETTINIDEAGTYKIWVRSKDYPTNKPGSRYFHVAFNGQRYPDKFGDHGKAGYGWEEAGVHELQPGSYKLELIDTSGFYARFGGVLVTSELDFVPSDDDTELRKVVAPYNRFNEILPPSYPAYAKEDIAAVKQDSIENESNKIVFYQGESSKGALVQYELYAKDKANGEWVLVKDKTEDQGFLMMYAKKASVSSKTMGSPVGIVADIGGFEVSSATDNYYRMGLSEWLMPADFEKISDKEVKLTFAPKQGVTFSATYSFDDFVDDLKVTIHASFENDGAYSFEMYNGNGVMPEQFDTVTAPMVYVKHALPETSILLSEPWMFTPMNTLHFTADNNVKTPGRALTAGLAVDPTCVAQHVAHPDTADFGTVFYTTGGQVRPHLVAPAMGANDSNFKAGDTYTFSYRVINRFEDWYDTYKHIAIDMYNCNDIRTNYYGSLNDTIYNTTELMLNDDYGGWDDDWMGWYNMEGKNLVTQSNFLTLFQRYLLTEDETLLNERVVPTIAYSLSRGGRSFMPSRETSTTNYASPMAPLSGIASGYGVSTYGGMYEMSQGRMPYLLDLALREASNDSVSNLGAMYKYTGDEAYKKELIATADAYLANNPMVGKNREDELVNNFVFGDYTIMTSTLVAAYELTGDQKYLDAAEEAGRLLMTSVWTTGYQNDYTTNTYHIDPAETTARRLNAENYNFWWHGAEKWRLGNVDGEAKTAQDLFNAGVLALPEEDVPGWLPSRTGQGTEHLVTPGHGNIITMNNWAGVAVRLSKYTGDEWFETQARNALVGRYTNYPGYYTDRYITHHMHPDYPYKGPDLTSVYWHHIPIFLTMVEDFLINEAWAKSNGHIEWPHLYQSGYAYFNSYHFGQEAGKFYDENDMWLWLDRGIIEVDNFNIDYVAARKDGVLGLALMNEDNAERTTTITLGDKIPNATAVNGKAIVYDENGNKAEADVVNGQFTLNIPSKGLRAVVIKDIEVKTPAFVKEYKYSNEIGSTASEHTNGKGYVIQVTDDYYHAYVYISDTSEQIQSATLTYTVNGKTESVTDTTQGIEWLVKVDDPNAEFKYTIEVTNLDGNKVSYGGGSLKTLANSTLKGTGVDVSAPPVVAGELDPALPNFDPIDVTYKAQGTGGGYIRLVIPAGQLPFNATKNILKNVKATIIMKEVESGKETTVETTLAGNEERSDGGTTLLVKPTQDMPVKDYDNDKAKTHKFIQITLSR